MIQRFKRVCFAKHYSKIQNQDEANLNTKSPSQDGLLFESLNFRLPLPILTDPCPFFVGDAIESITG